jgi:hypothetical protein
LSTQAKPKTLKQLQRTWYAKLKKEGFEDIESPKGGLKRSALGLLEHATYGDNALTRASYYRMAGYLLHDYIFENQREKLVWSMHSEGKDQRTMIKELRRRRMRGANFDAIRATIQKLEAEMKKRYQDNVESSEG